MSKLRLPSNIKVHFAGSEVQSQFLSAKALGISYYLYTAYPFVERMVFDKGSSPLMPLDWQKDNPYKKIPQFIIQNSLHTIQDSGLFTLLFGSRKGTADYKLISRWYDALVEFTLNYSRGATCVEVDSQKIIGVEKTWEFRYKLAKDIPNRIINVFHPEDGSKGLDRLIEYSNYIALSVPELKALGLGGKVNQLTQYIKKKKPSIDIHLLGCTDLKMLRANRFCTSSDSTSWLSLRRYGIVDKFNYKGSNNYRIDYAKVSSLISSSDWDEILKYNKEYNASLDILSISNLKRLYEEAAGNQNYNHGM